MSRIRHLYLVGHTHHDVGYTLSPRLVDGLHTEIVTRVLDLCDEHDGDGPDAFRWTFEVSRPVLKFVAEATPQDVARLVARVNEGRISLTGGYLNMTQLPSEAELDVAYDALSTLRDAGLTLRTEQHGDVNGIAWGTVEQMRRAGLDRLVMALNPDHGRPPLTQPSGFWWEGVSGQQVFVWLSTHYGIGEEWGIIDGDVDLAVQRIGELVADLEAREDYPYDAALVHAANDNRWPTALFLDVVRRWNQLHPDRPMRTATTDQALDALLESASGDAVPALRGEWSDWWSHGHGSTAREVAVYREARSFTRAAGSHLALTMLRGDGPVSYADVIGYRRAPVRSRPPSRVVRDLDAVDEQLLLFGEHTWGSWETYSKPFSTLSHSHWNAKAGFAYGAWDVARDLAVEGMHRLVASGTSEQLPEVDATQPPTVVVTNPTETERTEPVEVEVDGARRVRLVATVPAFGLTRLPLPEEGEVRTESERVDLTFGHYRLTVSRAGGGLVSLVDERHGRELVDTGTPHALGAVVVESVRPGSTHPMLTRSPKDFHPDNPGPDFDRTPATMSSPISVTTRSDAVTVEWESTPPGLPPARTTLTIYRDTPAIDLAVHLVKPEAFGPESIFVAFPFAFAEPQFLLETAGAVYRPEEDQLPDTSKDWYSIQQAIGVGDVTSGVLWSSYDAPLVQLGDFHTGTWARTLEPRTGHINSWLMNNLHFTNFQARQEGTRTYRYRFLPIEQPPAAAQVATFGRDAGVPLQARATRIPVPWQGTSGLSVTSDGDVLTELRPVSEDQVRVRLRETAGNSARALVETRLPGHRSTREVTVPAWGRADVVLDVRERREDAEGPAEIDTMPSSGAGDERSVTR
ncbi:hypothetical protein [Ruania alba]|uniref:Glycosyl hydrolases family 38 C-terminal domain-containing protein n=1 Tax=Ruania alba TaxID=648782 RepID=A0A1H5GBY1_9MICO|nr:hypothetical protein [Ruania alba]SEE13165.1 Glycosyl hydrolases family 38 C-terminal domain-containing protein [Ruania alba]